MYRFYNIFVNKIVNVLIVAILILIAFFIGLNTANALEVSMWGTDYGDYIDSLTSTSSYTYSDYNSDTIKEFIFNRSNEQFFDNSLTQAEFYKQFNYVVMGYSQSTIRVFVQNYNLVMDYQGLNAIEGNDTRFFFANMTCYWGKNAYVEWKTGVNVIYSYFIDINYNTMSYTFSSDNPFTDLSFSLLGSDYRNSDGSTSDINMRLFDSYNGNFSWIESWYSVDNTDTLWRRVADYTYSYDVSRYYNNLVEFPELQYVSSGTPEEEDPDSGGGGSSSDIGDKIDDTNDKLDGIKGVIDGIFDIVGEISTEVKDRVSDGINGAKDILQSIYDFLTGAFTGYDSIEDFFESITFEDNGGISRIVSAPLDLIRSLINNDSCSPLLLPIWGKDIEVPSGCILWENATDEINTLWHTLICGAGGYFILTSLFKDIEKIKNPRNSEVSTLDL